jgi:hypothetical protein
MRTLKSFGRFWYDFVVGEDWRIAAGVVAVLALGAGLVAGGVLSSGAVAVVVALAIVLVVLGSIVGAALAGRR